MSDQRAVGRCLWAAIVAIVLAPVAMAAAPAADRDAREVDTYVLTEAAFARYAQATKKVQAMPHGAAAGCGQGDEGEDNSIAAQVARLEARPGVAAAVRSAGLSTRDYVVISWSLVQAGLASWAAAQPGARQPTGTLMANVTFYRAHEDAIKALTPASRSDDCASDDDDR